MSTTSPEPEESNEPLFPESQTSLRKFLLDSALIVAVISASCFALGQFALLPDAEKAGIPNHLVPEPAVQTVATIGGIYLFVAGVFLFFAYAIVRACLLAFSPVWRERQAASARKRYLQHPADYSILAVFVLLVCLVTFVRLGPSLGSWGWRFQDEKLSSVSKLEVVGTSIPFARGSLLYVTRRDGLIVLKWKGRKQYVVFREELLQVMELSKDD